MLIELHCHTDLHSGCSIIDPETLVRQAIKQGLQGVVITEHHYQWNTEDITRLRERAEVDNTFLILAGQEVETDIGHVLVYGADQSISDRIELNELRQRYPSAALVWAHPFRYGKNPDGKALLNPFLDGVEIFSMNHSTKENCRGLTSWHEHKFTAVSGSDTHSLKMAAMYPTLFDHPVKTIQDVAVEIKAGRCRPLFKEIPSAGSNIMVTKITIGSKGADESRSSIVLKEISGHQKWKKTKKTISLIKTLRRSGLSKGTFRVPRIIDVNDETCVLIEERQRGKTLFELVSSVNLDVGRAYFQLAARWLATLHGLNLKLRHPEDAGQRFEEEITFFELRGNMSIASFLIKVGKGESDDMDWIIQRSLDLMGKINTETDF